MGQAINPSTVGYKGIDLSWMVGRVITEVAFHEPSQWSFAFGPEANLGVQCLWRIVQQGGIALTSEDHGQQFGLPGPVDAAVACNKLIANLQIAGVNLREDTADIAIEFMGNVRLEIFPNSAGYESWQLRDPSGMCFVAQGGGQISKWKP